MKKRKLIIFVVALALVALAVLYYAAIAPAVVGKDRVAVAFGAAMREGPGVELRRSLWPTPLLSTPPAKRSFGPRS